jgi:hypothetical protein
MLATRISFMNELANLAERLRAAAATYFMSAEPSSPGGHVAAHHLLQAGLVDRDAALFENADLGRIDIEAKNVVADFGETSAGHQTDVAGVDNGNLREKPS